MHIALGGCLRPPPVPYGLTEDTGGHIAYILGAAMAQAGRADVSQVEIVTRAFDAPHLGACHAMARQEVASGCTILRLRTGQGGYLAKEDLDAELPALEEAFLTLIAGQDDRPDILHAHFADAALLARAAARRFGIPWIYSSHSLALDKAGPGRVEPHLARRIARERSAIADADAIVASSRDEAERQLPAYVPGVEGRVHHIAPGITSVSTTECDRGARLIAPFLRDTAKPIILAIARPIEKKNLAGLLRAYAGSTALQDRANLVILAGLRAGLTTQGAEPDRVTAELFDIVDRNDLWGRVALPRWHDGETVASLYALTAKGGVFVNPAHHEPFGLTIIEAAHADVPVVATRNGGPADILRALGSGELIDPADSDDIASAIQRVLDDPQRTAKARRAGQVARRRYDWHTWASRVSDVCGALTVPRDCTSGPARRLLACDIDGTLTGDRGGSRRFAAWHARTGDDTRFCVATGRSIVEARRVLADWALPEPEVFITSVGSEIWRRTGRGQKLCTDYAAAISAGWDRAETLAVLQALGIPFQPAYDQRRWKLSLFGDAADARRIEDALRVRGLRARVVHSHGRLIDVLPHRAGKAAAVRFEAARLGLHDRDCIVAGDSGNDRDMLTEFPHAILPANAAAELADLRHPVRSALAYADGVLDGLDRLDRVAAQLSREAV